jgi:hypothetical protein
MKNSWSLPLTLRSVRGRRCRSYRKRRALGILALAVFLGGWVVDAGGFHPCPHHDHGFPGPELHEPELHEPEGHGHGDRGHGAHGPVAHAHVHGHEIPPGPPSHSHHDDPCTCRGDCAGAAPIPVASAPTGERTPPTVPVRRVDAVPVFLPTPFLLPHVLPWSTAPPRA